MENPQSTYDPNGTIRILAQINRSNLPLINFASALPGAPPAIGLQSISFSMVPNQFEPSSSPNNEDEEGDDDKAQSLHDKDDSSQFAR